MLSQYISGAGIMLYTMKKRPDLRMRGAPLRLARVKGDRQLFGADLRAAIDHEPGHLWCRGW